MATCDVQPVVECKSAASISRSISSYQWKSGTLADCDPKFPTRLSAWVDDKLTFGNYGSSHFGFVVDGPSVLETPQGRFELQPGMYFCVSGSCSISQGRGIVMSRVAFDGLFQIGGPVEKKGRLKYIDGCTDTLLISPIKLGDPCLNLLCFPEGIDQTSHTHPSDRIGVVCRGRGDCVTPERTIELTPGLIFRIHADGEHKFRTLKGSEMSVVAFHPDSDFGPTDQFHPMINRTIVDGISASMLKEIHTR